MSTLSDLKRDAVGAARQQADALVRDIAGLPAAEAAEEACMVFGSALDGAVVTANVSGHHSNADYLSKKVREAFLGRLVELQAAEDHEAERDHLEFVNEGDGTWSMLIVGKEDRKVAVFPDHDAVEALSAYLRQQPSILIGKPTQTPRVVK